MALFALIWFVVVLGSSLRRDYKKWLERKTWDHTTMWFVRALLLQPCVVFLVWNIDKNYWFLQIPLAEFIAALSFWLLFDGLYNVIRGFDWWFNGSKDAVGDSKIDRWLMTLEDHEEAAVKCIPLGIFILVYAIYFL